MSHKGPEKKRGANLRRWKSERGGRLWEHGPSEVGRSFEEDLALFERQVRGERADRGPGPGPAADLPA